MLAVSGVNRAAIRGSFLLSAFSTVGGDRVHIGTEAVLSRWNVQGCANCQTHLEAKAVFAVPPAGTGVMAARADVDLADEASYDVEVRTRDWPPPKGSERPRFRLELR
jgi:tyrosinase